jgi:hypothetical protein
LSTDGFPPVQSGIPGCESFGKRWFGPQSYVPIGDFSPSLAGQPPSDVSVCAVFAGETNGLSESDHVLCKLFASFPDGDYCERYMYATGELALRRFLILRGLVFGIAGLTGVFFFHPNGWV